MTAGARRVTLTVVLLVMASLGCIVRPSPSASQDWPVHQWNLQAIRDWADFVSTKDQAIFFSLYAPHRPFAVAFNEVCYNQFLEIRDAFGDNGYATTTINWVRIANESDVCFGQQIGNVVFLRGAAPSHAYINHQNYGTAGDPYFRKGVCNRVATFLGDIAACSDHLSNLQ